MVAENSANFVAGQEILRSMLKFSEKSEFYFQVAEKFY